MKTTAMLAVLGCVLTGVFTSGAAFAQSYHVRHGSQMLKCSATGKVSGITELFFQETDLEGQFCGYYKAGEAAAKYTCFNGSIFGAENVLAESEARYGVNKLSLRSVDGKGYSLVLAFECDWNHEERCIPGTEDVISSEELQCSLTTLKY